MNFTRNRFTIKKTLGFLAGKSQSKSSMPQPRIVFYRFNIRTPTIIITYTLMRHSTVPLLKWLIPKVITTKTQQCGKLFLKFLRKSPVVSNKAIFKINICIFFRFMINYSVRFLSGALFLYCCWIPFQNLTGWFSYHVILCTFGVSLNTTVNLRIFK